MGQAFDDLMLQLGYSRYVGQGGDFGSHILRLMSVDAPDSLVSILSNMLSVAPSPDDMQRFAANLTTPEETALIGMLTDPAFSWTKTFWDIESQLPLQAALGLTDSPIAWMAWPYKGMRMLVPGYEWSIHELITWSLLNFIQGPYGTFRLYKEAKRVSPIVAPTSFLLAREKGSVKLMNDRRVFSMGCSHMLSNPRVC